MNPNNIWKIWICVFLLALSGIFAYYTITVGSAKQNGPTFNVQDLNKDFEIKVKKDKEELKPAISVPKEPIRTDLIPVGDGYNQFRDNFKNLKEDK